LRDHPHISIEGSDVCAHCGQPLPPTTVTPVYDRRASKRTGLAVTILLHLLLVAIYLFQPKTKQKVAAPAGSEAIVWVAPGKPKPQQQAPKSAPKTRPHRTPPEQVQVQRLPNTITLPHEKHVEVAREEPKKEVREAPPEVDMQAYIEARRKQRGAPEPSQATEESDEAKGMRNALANIAAANNRGRDDSNETGGIFSISNRTFHSAELKFRGWNPSFKRRWLTQLTVEQGGEPDLETAIVKKMIELIRKEKTGDFEWDSHRLGKVVKMSARVQDTAELQAFLIKEMFGDDKAGRR
jgi:type IV secretory pathway VirB10-like protein